MSAPLAITLPTPINLSAKDVSTFINAKYESLENLETDYRATVMEAVDVAYAGKEKLAPKRSQPSTAIVLDVSIGAQRPCELVISVDNATTTRRDDCFQVYWLEDTTETATPRLCAKIHIVQASLSFPVSSSQDKAYLASVKPTHFTTTNLRALRIPPIPDVSSADFVAASLSLANEIFFQEDVLRPAITAEIYYNFDPKTHKLTRDEGSTIIYYSKVRIGAALSFGPDLESALEPLKSFSLEKSMNYDELKQVLKEANVKDAHPLSHDAIIAAHLANLVSSSLEILLPEGMKRVGPSESIPKIHVNRRRDRSFNVFSAVLSPSAIRLLSEFSSVAVAKLMSHPVLRQFIITKEYRVSDIDKVRAALAWATGFDTSPQNLPVANLLDYYKEVFGVWPDLFGRYSFVSNTATAVRCTMTHPGRDYVHLHMQRLLGLWINEQVAPSDQASSKRQKGDFSQQTATAARSLFGDKYSTFESCKQVLSLLNADILKRSAISDAASAINTRLLLTKCEASSELPLPCVITASRNDEMIVKVPMLSLPSSPVEVSVSWRSTVLAPPPIGTTLPVVVSYNAQKGVYAARWYYPEGLANSVLPAKKAIDTQ